MQNRNSSHTQTLLLNVKITKNRGQRSDPRGPTMHLGYLPARWDLYLPENAATRCSNTATSQPVCTRHCWSVSLCCRNGSTTPTFFNTLCNFELLFFLNSEFNYLGEKKNLPINLQPKLDLAVLRQFCARPPETHICKKHACRFTLIHHVWTQLGRNNHSSCFWRWLPAGGRCRKNLKNLCRLCLVRFFTSQ